MSVSIFGVRSLPLSPPLVPCAVCMCVSCFVCQNLHKSNPVRCSHPFDDTHTHHAQTLLLPTIFRVCCGRFIWSTFSHFMVKFNMLPINSNNHINLFIERRNVFCCGPNKKKMEKRQRSQVVEHNFQLAAIRWKPKRILANGFVVENRFCVRKEPVIARSDLSRR